MLIYEKIDISDGIDVDMSDGSKECMLCHYWHFLRTLAMDHIFVMDVIT